MSILVTGGTGFIGAAVVRLLVETGTTDITVMHHSPSSPGKLSDVADKVNFMRGDIGEFAHVMDIVEKTRPEAIYHMSAMLSIPSEADPVSAIRTNAMGTHYVLEAARMFGVKQVLFASSIGTYGYGLGDGAIDDTSLQRPGLLYGATKVFGEHLGLFYKRKYGIDFRGIRYQSIIGPGVRTPGMVQFTSWMIENSAKGKSTIVDLKPETRIPVLYIKDAAKATLQLAAAPAEKIKMTNYLLNGHFPSAGELADMVRQKVPGAQIDFQPDPQRQAMADRSLRPIDGQYAKKEWGWEPTYTLEAIVDDMLNDLDQYPQRFD